MNKINNNKNSQLQQLKIGVLSFQGSVEEHLHILNSFDNVKAIPVKTLSALNEVDGLILPGGESTTISKLLDIFGLTKPLVNRINNGMAVWGTCAGLILLAKKIKGEASHLNVMDISVERNAYGTQIDSFVANSEISEISDKKLPLVFIRAPWIESAKENVQILSKVNGHIVAAKQKNMLATSFHPELTENKEFHKYFIKMVKKSKLNSNVY